MINLSKGHFLGVFLILLSIVFFVWIIMTPVLSHPNEAFAYFFVTAMFISGLIVVGVARDSN